MATDNNRHQATMPFFSMYRCSLPVSFLLLVLLASGGDVRAEGGWRNMPADDRRQMRQDMRDHWQQERHYRQEEGDRRWGSVPPEDRRRMREEIRDQRAPRAEREDLPQRYDGNWRRH